MLLLSSALAVAALAQHHNPFAGSGCNCSTFCAKECAIFPTKAHNTTLYRMTPLGVTTLAEKNTADVPGDVSFVISKRTTAYECRKDPSQFQCSTFVQFDGDDSNSTDLVLEVTVEVDGQWGPYLYCNDVNTSDPLGAWACTTTLQPVPDYPKTCVADGYEAYPDFCYHGEVKKSEVVDDLAACCALATKEDGKKWSFNTTSAECTVYSIVFGYQPCNGTVTGYYDGPSSQCDCARVHETVGLENVTSQGRKYYIAGGLWLSHPANGECTDGHYVGDGSGCTWRHVETTRVINATCVYERIDVAVEEHDPLCFVTCPRHNKTTDCYNECYQRSSADMTVEELTAPWKGSFAGKTACPEVSTLTGQVVALPVVHAATKLNH